MPMETGQRRTPRFPFGAVAEVTGSKSGRYLVAVTRELGRLGCFVKTTPPLLAGEGVSLRITHNDQELAVHGEVVYVRPAEGMGIAFGEVSVTGQAILESWLAESRLEHS